MPPKSIRFICLGEFSGTNHSVIENLSKQFPENEIDIVDVYDLVPLKRISNILHSILEYGISGLHNKEAFRNRILTSSYYFKRCKEELTKEVDTSKYLFSFQTQSIFDASIPGLPHFLYTDNTFLENIRYPGFSRYDVRNEVWLDLERTIYQNANMNFVMSHNVQKSIVRDYQCDPSKVAVVYAGPNADVPRHIPDRDYDNQNIIFVGLDWNRKGGPTLLKSFRNVLKVYPDATLTIVGCSPDMQLSNCNVVGRISSSEVSRLYDEASVFCLPTNREPFGIVYIEAMHHKLPVIGTDIGAIPDFIKHGENGFLVEPGNSEELTGYLLKLLAEPSLCKKFGLRGHVIAESLYTWDNTAKLMKEHILEAI